MIYTGVTDEVIANGMHKQATKMLQMADNLCSSAYNASVRTLIAGVLHFNLTNRCKRLEDIVALQHECSNLLQTRDEEQRVGIKKRLESYINETTGLSTNFTNIYASNSPIAHTEVADFLSSLKPSVLGKRPREET
jgi:t-SNARE complex subunit (syntaxin)